MEILAIIVGGAAFLVFVIGGMIFRVPQKFLLPIFLVVLLLVLAFLLKGLPKGIIILCLVGAVIVSARLMFFHAP